MTDHAESLDLSVVPTANLDDATRREIIDLCNRAFETDEFNGVFNLIAESVNPMHVLGRVTDVLVGHATWSTRRVWLADGTCLTTAHLDGVATDPDQQGRGIGSAVIERVQSEITDFDIGTLSTHRQSFYERMGWQRWLGPTARRRGSDEVPTPDEPVMVLRRPRTPELDLTSLLVIEARRGNSW